MSVARRAAHGWRWRACLTGAAALAAATLAASPVAADAPRAVSVEAGAVSTLFPAPLRATLTGPTDRYPHNVLGRIPGWSVLEVEALPCASCRPVVARLDLPANRVFEDIAPRLWDINGDGRAEVVVVESDARLGARLTVWMLRAEDDADAPLFQLLAASEFIGTRFRWLAPVGAADFTGDGQAEIAFVDRPHLARTLRLVALRDARLQEIAAFSGATNHRIGEERLTGGLRDCGTGPEAILASADWTRLLAVRLQRGRLVAIDIGPFSGEEVTVQAALDCQR